MPELTKEHIAERRSGIHTYESFGRALIERVCHVAEERIGKKPVKMLEIDDAGIYVKPVYRDHVLFCIEICFKIGCNWICIHVPEIFDVHAE